jgi:hypothetical protein
MILDEKEMFDEVKREGVYVLKCNNSFFVLHSA